jgi:hypothetical protein
MRNFFYILIFLQLSSFTLQAQTLFTRTYGAFGEFNVGQSVVSSADGGYVFLGSTGGWGAVNGDMALVKTDSLGNSLWEHIYGNEFTEQGISVKRISNGGFVLAGITNEGVAGDYNIRVVQVDSMGEEVWSKTFGGSAWEIVVEVIVVSDGGFAIAATTYEEPFESGTFYLIKIDSLGNVVWENKFPNGSSNSVGGIDELADGSIYLGGRGIQIGHSDYDMLLVKYSSTGVIQWSNYYGDFQNEAIIDLTHSPENRICLAGNKTQNEGNTREIIYVVDTAGVVTNINDFNSPRMIDVKSVFYSQSDSSFVIAADHISDIETRATIYKFDYFLNYVCYASANSIKNSYVGEATVTNDGFIVMNGTYDFVAPGLSSFFLMKTTLNCDANMNVIIGIEENENDLSDKFMAFPNPNSGNFNIRLNINPELIELLDLTGKVIPFSASYQAEILSIDAGSIAPGMYVLKIQTSQNSPITYHSIIINR